jgi:hypothetical protein
VDASATALESAGRNPAASARLATPASRMAPPDCGMLKPYQTFAM